MNTEAAPRKTIAEIASSMLVSGDIPADTGPELEVVADLPPEVSDAPEIPDEPVVDETPDDPADSIASQEDPEEQGDDEEVMADAEDVAEQPNSDTDDQYLDITDDDMFEVKIDGKIEYRSVADAKKALSSDGVHEQRVREATELRNKAREDFVLQTQQMDEAKETFVKTVEVFEQNMLVPLISPPPEDLRVKNPAQFIKHNDAYIQDQQRLNAVRGEIAKMVSGHQRTQQQSHQEKMQIAANKLRELRPHFADPETAPETFKGIVQTAVNDYGYTAKELGDSADHRLYMVLEDARKFRELTSKGSLDTSEVATKRVRAPRKLRSGATRVRSTQIAQQKQAAGLRDNAKKSGKVKDVAQLLAVPSKRR